MREPQGHRGPAAEDRLLFATNKVAILRKATQHFSWLLGQGYDAQAAIKLVGDHFQLRQRQRLAIASSSCADRNRDSRQKSQRLLGDLVGRPLAIDGLHCINTVEAAILGGVLVRGRDRGLRELPIENRLASHLAEESVRTIGLLANLLSVSQLQQVTWVLDRRSASSSSIREELEGLLGATKWPWRVDLVTDRSKSLTSFDGTVATTDSLILDRVNAWIDLPSVVVDRFLPGAWIIDLSEPEA